MTGPLSHAEVLARWTGAFVDELVACGLRDVCLCPGSRSTPLALTLARHPAIALWTHLDERSCAYFALGMAKLRRGPVAVLCSSGTAAVNFAPAVVEAFHSHVPLVVLTADRPPELQDLGANQTIKQAQLYGPAVKWSTQLPLPEASDEMLRYVRMVAGRSVVTALEAPRGPVHLNFPFREPLLPAPYAFAAATSTPPTAAQSAAAPAAVTGAGLPRAVRRGLIVAGPGTVGGESAALTRLAVRLGWPVLADPLSGLRGAGPAFGVVLGAYDGFLRSAALSEALAPELILRFGDPPTSKPLATYLQRHPVRQVVVAPPGTWPDPDLTASEMVHADAESFCTSVLAALDAQSEATSGTPQRHELEPPASSGSGWLTTWQAAELAARKAIDCVLDDLSEATEPSAVVDLAAAIPDGATIVAGNSMPVRDLDSFFPADTGRRVALLGNRGASGIDGVVSTALGVAAAASGRVALLIGDLSFYHDMNGLLAAQRHHLNATIVLINNDGGGIFSFLPQHADAEHFEQLFGTPHGLDFSHVAALYGVEFQRVATRQAYRAALAASFASTGVQIIEVRTDREANLELHQCIWDEIASAVATDATGAAPGSGAAAAE